MFTGICVAVWSDPVLCICSNSDELLDLLQLPAATNAAMKILNLGPLLTDRIILKNSWLITLRTQGQECWVRALMLAEHYQILSRMAAWAL